MSAISQGSLSNPFQLMNACIEAIRDYVFSHIRVAFNIIQCQCGIMMCSLRQKFECLFKRFCVLFSILLIHFGASLFFFLHVLFCFVCPTMEAAVDYPLQQCCCWQKQVSLPVHQWTFPREVSAKSTNIHKLRDSFRVRNAYICYVCMKMSNWNNVYSSYSEMNQFFCSHLDMFNFNCTENALGKKNKP